MQFPESIGDVNRALADEGYTGITVHRNHSHFFFGGKPTRKWLHNCVAVDRVHDISIAEWLRTFKSFAATNAALGAGQIDRLESRTPCGRSATSSSFWTPLL